jgi:hypothetical protein
LWHAFNQNSRPQSQRYCLISFFNCHSMNNKQGHHPINGIWLDNELKSSPALFPEQRISKPIDPKSHFNGNLLVKTVMFVCKECNGPLTPLSSCIVCKRTSQRKCTRCGSKVPYGFHMPCEYLALLGTFHSNKLNRKMESDL